MNSQITETSPAPLPIVDLTVRLCAWCLREQGIMAGNGSHGICTGHKDAVLRAHRELRAAKQNRKING